MDLLCFSHLRWDFVYQRPNHLMSRAAAASRVFYIEEPVCDDGPPRMTRSDRDGVTIVVPHVTKGGRSVEAIQLRSLLDRLVAEESIVRPLLWYYTPMALPWSRHLQATASGCIYDCMDHLAGFEAAPQGLLALERELMASADLVFTGGASLHEEKRQGHDAVHCFPSSVDTTHFRQARALEAVPDDQAAIARPRIGYFGVIDERIDLELIAGVATARPDWQFVLVGPTAKIKARAIPTAANIHTLGPKPYADLPAYLAGWDVAMMPFARNAATRFISPTKTPEYLAGGRPVVSTSIRDVVVPYGDAGLVHIADTTSQFVKAVETALGEDRADLMRRADALLADRSWDRTWAEMQALVQPVVAARLDRRTRRAERAGWERAGVPPARQLA